MSDPGTMEAGLQPRAKTPSGPTRTSSGTAGKKVSAVEQGEETREGKGLHQMAREGNVNMLEDVDKPGKVDWKDINSLDGKDGKEGNSPLHYAARYSHVEMTKKLLELGAKPDMKGSDKMTPLHYACRYGRNVTERSRVGRTQTEGDDGLDTVKELVKAGASLTKKDEWDLQPLHHAAMQGNYQVVEYLVKLEGVKIDCMDEQGSTPLHISATYGNTRVTELLLAAGAKTICMDKFQNETPLHRAVKGGNNCVVTAIVEHFDDKGREQLMKQRDKVQNTPLLLAAQVGNSEAVKIFMDECGSARYVNQSNSEKECPLHFACRNGDEETAKILVYHHARLDIENKDRETPLHLVADKAELVTFLLQSGAPMDAIDHRGQTPIMTAASKGHTNVVRILRKHEADLSRKDVDVDVDLEMDVDDRTLIHLAAQHNQTEVLQLLLEPLLLEPHLFEKAKLVVNRNDQYDNTPLHVACEEGHYDTVKFLLRCGAHINNKNEDEETPFHLAAKAGHLDVVELMLKKEQTKDSRLQSAILDQDEHNNTALHLASTANMAKTVEALLKQGASVSQINDKGWTALDCAAATGANKCATLLLAFKSPVDHLDRKNRTPLHLTAINGHPRLASLLLENKPPADVALEDIKGFNALELAIKNNNKPVAEVIIDSDFWRSAMKSCRTVKDPESKEFIPDTPMRMLIRTFPDLAQKVFDKCIERKKAEMVLEYEFLEDTFSFKFLENTFSWRKEIKEVDVCFPPVSSPPDARVPYHTDGEIIKANHCLMLMVQNQQKHLLKHPLCLGLLRHKWNSFGMYVFYFQFLFYCLYLSSIITYTLLELDAWPALNSQLPTPNSQVEDTATTIFFHAFFRNLVFIFVGINIAIEIFQLVMMRLKYFSLGNILDLGLFLISLAFALDFSAPWMSGSVADWKGCTADTCWRWPVGSFIVTCGSLNLLTYFRQLPRLGIFIIMFNDVFMTMTRFLAVMVVFIVAFGLGFHLLFINNTSSAFDTPWYAMLKTFVMMTGEFDYGSIFDQESDSVPFPIYSTILFIVFVLVMSIVIMNLLVGLAVHDIKEIQENAELRQLSMNVELVLDLEKLMTHAFKKRYSKQKETFALNARTSGIIHRLWNQTKKLWNATMTSGVKDVLSKANITTRQDKDGDQDGNLDMIIKKQRELTAVVKALGAQVEVVLEESGEVRSFLGEVRSSLARLEAAAREGGTGGMAGGKN